MTEPGGTGPLRLEGRTCVVTGATSGIGLATSIGLARQGAQVVLVGRDRTRIASAEALVRQAGPEAPSSELADLSILGGVRDLAQRLQAHHRRIDVLINNAGAIFARREVTHDGIERTLALNVAAPYVLTNLLLDRLKASTPSRIVNIVSAAHRGASLAWDNLQGERTYFGYGAYSRSKLALILLTYEWARRLVGSRVTSNAVHPGFVRSRFGRNNSGWLRWAIRTASVFAMGPQKGAETPIWAASAPELEGITGKYLVRRRATASSDESYRRDEGLRLWEALERLTGNNLT